MPSRAGGAIHTQLLPFAMLTERERNVQRDKAKELLRFLQVQGFRVEGYVTLKINEYLPLHSVLCFVATRACAAIVTHIR